MDDGREGQIFDNLIKGAVHQVFTNRHDGIDRSDCGGV